MSYGENPGQVIDWTIHTDLAYSPTADFGNANAGKDLVLGFNGGFASDGGPVLGKFMDVDQNQEGSVMISGTPMVMRQKAKGGCTVGSKVVGAGDGQIKNAPATTAGNTNGRGRVLKVLDDVANGRVLVQMPAN